MRVVASLTTMPHRYAKLYRTLINLQKQTHKLDAIYVGLPEKSRRLSIEYPPMPEKIKKISSIVPLNEDYGPISKIMGALFKENDPETIIISFDDDVMYPDDLVEKMLEFSQDSFHSSALGGSGFKIGYGYPFYGAVTNVPNNLNRIINIKVPETGLEVDILCGFAGVLYQRRFFAEDFLSFVQDKFMHDPNLFLNDDVTISGYLSAKGIKRKVFTLPGPAPQVSSDFFGDFQENENEINNISYDKFKFLQRFHSAIKKSSELGFFTEPAPIAMTDSVLFMIFFIVILLIIFFVLLFLAYRNF